MTDREKLIKLLWDNYNDHPWAFSGLTDDFEHEADYLLSHGVTVREKGEWALEHGSYGAIICPICKHEALLEQSRISTNLLYVESNFCPNCGADMRGANDG